MIIKNFALQTLFFMHDFHFIFHNSSSLIMFSTLFPKTREHPRIHIRFDKFCINKSRFDA